MARKISVEIVGDSRQLERAFARSSRSAQKFNRDMNRGFKGTLTSTRSLARSIPLIGAAFSGAAVVGGMKAMVDAASDLNEQINRTRVTFGYSAASIEQWSETTATAIGLSQTAALEATSNFGAMFKTIGTGDRQASQMSRRLVQLGADMASFNNQDPSEMLDRLRAGLAGEAEPLRRFGVFLSEARVKQEAYRSGLAKVGDELTEQQKVQARYNLILRDTRLQQGDFARTSGGLANQMRILRAQFRDLTAKLGTALLPVVTDLVERFNEWLSDPENQQRIIKDFTTAVEGLATAFEKTASAVGFFADTWDRSLTDMGRDLFRKHVLRIDTDAKKAGEQAGESYTLGFGTAVREHLDIRRRGRKVERERQRAGPTRPTGRTAAERERLARLAAMRIQAVDAKIARQLDRLQDLSLRKQLARLKEIGAAIRQRLAATTDITRRLTLEDKLLDVTRQQRDVQAEITDQIKAANEALKARADAIKSAVIERLQRRQTDILNRRALADAREQLRIARQIGGRFGIREAARAVQDAAAAMRIARVEAARPTLTPTGRFALAGVTININGVTDPEEVARRVTAILQKRRRRTTNQTRGPAAGSAAGAH